MMDDSLVSSGLALVPKLLRECRKILLAFRVLRLTLEIPPYLKIPQMEDMAGFVLQHAFLSIVLPGA